MVLKYYMTKVRAKVVGFFLAMGSVFLLSQGAQAQGNPPPTSSLSFRVVHGGASGGIKEADYSTKTSDQNLTSLNAYTLFSFQAMDTGGDSIPTVIQSISFKVGNSINLKKIALLNGTTNIGEVKPSGDITFGALSINIPDGTTSSILSVVATFDKITDQQFIQVELTSVTIGVAMGSQTIPITNIGTTSNTNKIEVEAKKIVLIPDTTRKIVQSIPFSLKFEIRDSSNNVSTTYNQDVTLSATDLSILPPGSLTKTAERGVIIFGGLKFSTSGDRQISVTSSSLSENISISVEALKRITVTEENQMLRYTPNPLIPRSFANVLIGIKISSEGASSLTSLKIQGIKPSYLTNPVRLVDSRNSNTIYATLDPSSLPNPDRDTITFSGFNIPISAGGEIFCSLVAGIDASVTTNSVTEATATINQNYVKFSDGYVSDFSVSRNITFSNVASTSKLQVTFSGAANGIRESDYGTLRADQSLTNVNSYNLFSMTVTDVGDDSSPTVIESLRFILSNTGNLKKIALFNGTTNIQEIDPATIVNFSGLSISVPNSTTSELSIRATFREDKISDGASIQVRLTDATTGKTGSGLTGFNNIETALDANTLRVDVKKISTELDTPIIETPQQTPFSITLKATDNFGNISTNYNGNVTLEPTVSNGTPSNNTVRFRSTDSLSKKFFNGKVTFQDLNYLDMGTYGMKFTFPNSFEPPISITIKVTDLIRITPTRLKNSLLGLCFLGNFQPLEDIVIEELVSSAFSTGTGLTFSLILPQGFKFNPNVGNFTVGPAKADSSVLSDLDRPSGIVLSYLRANEVVEITYNCRDVARLDKITISGLAIRYVEKSNGSGDIVRNGGSAIQRGNGFNDNRSFGRLTAVDATNQTIFGDAASKPPRITLMPGQGYDTLQTIITRGANDIVLKTTPQANSTNEGIVTGRGVIHMQTPQGDDFTFSPKLLSTRETIALLKYTVIENSTGQFCHVEANKTFSIIDNQTQGINTQYCASLNDTQKQKVTANIPRQWFSYDSNINNTQHNYDFYKLTLRRKPINPSETVPPPTEITTSILNQDRIGFEFYIEANDSLSSDVSTFVLEAYYVEGSNNNQATVLPFEYIVNKLPIANPDFTGVGDNKYCYADLTAYELRGNKPNQAPSNATIIFETLSQGTTDAEKPIVQDAPNQYKFYPSRSLPSTLGNSGYEIKYQIKDNDTKCSSEKSIMVYVYRNPELKFDVFEDQKKSVPISGKCIKSEGDNNVLFHLSPAISSIPFKELLWNVGSTTLTERSIGGNFNGTEYGFSSGGNYIIKLSATDTVTHCSNSATQMVNIGYIPTPNLYVNKFCTGDLTKFNIVPGFSEAAKNSTESKFRYELYFDDANPSGLSTQGTFLQNLDITRGTHSYQQSGTYNLKLTITQELDKLAGQSEPFSCSNTINQTVSITPKINKENYNENFNNPNTSDWIARGWISNQPNSDWNLDTPNSSWAVIKNPIDGKAWTLHQKKTPNYSKNQRSALYSPCFDLSKINYPIISFDYWSNMLDVDGAYLEYSSDGETWQALGASRTSGKNWYNSNAIAGLVNLTKPDNLSYGQSFGQYGWTGSSPDWQKASYNISYLNFKDIRFRFVFGSNSDMFTDSLSAYDGFAMDNFQIYERNRKILLEHFKSSNPAEEIDGVSSFLSQRNNSIIAINYYAGLSNYNEPKYLANTADPDARALFYGLTKPSYTFINGVNSATSDTEQVSNWGQKLYDQLILDFSPYSFQLTGHVEESVIKVDAKIASLIDITNDKEDGNNKIIQIALVEKVANDLIVHQLFPNALGTNLTATESREQTISIKYPWNKAGRITNHIELGFVIFIQNINTKEVYQSEYFSLQNIVDNPNELQRPLVTGIAEDRSDKGLVVYPVPARAEIYVELNFPTFSERTEMTIESMTGKNLIKNQYMTPNVAVPKIPVNISGLEAGIYLLKVQNAEQTHYKKFIVEK